VGELDFAVLQRGVAAAPGDAVITASFAMLATGLLVKAAQVPFQFWLSDAHAVAPSPVSVIFSGTMVALGLFGLARLTWAVFAPSDAVLHVVHGLLLWMGAASAVLGGVMALKQRHVKRLLAFSTISHTGIMLIGLALLGRQGLSGMLVYMVGHGLVKGALFMVAGILLATCGGIDEIGLRGKGRDIWPAGVAMAAGGLLLAGLPVGLMDEGTGLTAAAARGSGQGWAVLAMLAGAACTGGAVLWVTGRVFLALGPIPGEEERSPTDEEQEKADRPLWLLLAPAALLLALSLPGAHAAGDYAMRAAAGVMHPDMAAILCGGPAPLTLPEPQPGDPLPWLPWVSVPLAIGIAAFELTQRRLPKSLVRGFDRLSTPLLTLLKMSIAGWLATMSPGWCSAWRCSRSHLHLARHNTVHFAIRIAAATSIHVVGCGVRGRSG